MKGILSCITAVSEWGSSIKCRDAGKSLDMWGDKDVNSKNILGKILGQIKDPKVKNSVKTGCLHIFSGAPEMT